MGTKATLSHNQLFTAKPWELGYGQPGSEMIRDHHSLLRVVWPPTTVSADPIDTAGLIIASRLNERKLIGQELHDNVNQLLTTAKLYMEMLEPGPARDQYLRKKSTDYIMMAIEEIRKISKEMVMSSEEEINLAESVRSIIRDTHFTTEICIRFNYDNRIESILSSSKKTALLRIVQEQVKNVVKYNTSCCVMIDLFLKNEEVILCFKDNGVGFDMERTGNGIGLKNIYERARACNGRAALQSAAGKGCAWTITIPVN